MFFIAVAYLGSYRLIQSLQDKPALFIFGGILMLLMVISFFKFTKRKENKYEIDKEIIKN
jgi:hypothetical protein